MTVYSLEAIIRDKSEVIAESEDLVDLIKYGTTRRDSILYVNSPYGYFAYLHKGKLIFYNKTYKNLYYDILFSREIKNL